LKPALDIRNLKEFHESKPGFMGRQNGFHESRLGGRNFQKKSEMDFFPNQRRARTGVRGGTGSISQERAV
jgi:hypothetical protein